MFCFQENHVDNVTPEALRNLLRHYETPRKLRKATAPASRRSVPPAPRPAAAPVPPSTRTAKTTGPVMVIKTPPPATQRMSVISQPEAKPEAKTDVKTPPRASIPPPLDTSPPEEGTD